MNLWDEPFFEVLFNTSVPRVILHANAPHFTIVRCNDAYKITSNTTGRDITGKSLWEVFDPYNAGSNGGKLVADAFKEAIRTKEKVFMPRFRYDIPLADQINYKENWWQLQVTPVVDENKEVAFLLLDNTNITEEVTTRHAIDEGLKREQLLNEELAAYNEELITSNEELLRSQAELQTLNDELEQQVARRTRALSDSEARFRTLVQQAPVGIAIYNGPDFVIEVANERMLEIWGRTNAIIGKPLLVARPELEGHSYLQVINDVYAHGHPHIAYEVKGGVVRNGKIEEGYFDVIYQPLKNNNDAITGLIAVINDVTERVQARIAIERMEEMLRLAVEAAELGTWYINAEAATREVVPSPRLKEFFGFHPDETMSYDAAINQIAKEYRDKVVTAIDAAISKGEAYDIEYPIIGYHDKRLRWVKATGRLYASEPGKAAHFSGTMADITDRRQHDQRKNDFISMVSHELKTPLTSLKAYIQLLQAKAVTEGNAYRINLLGKAEMQVSKMHKMINGFLSVAALESGKMQLVKAPFNLDATVQAMVDDAIITNPRFTFNFLPCEPLSILADKDKIEQVITNLISNAVKYSPDGGEILISCQRVGSQAHISVKDNGIGIKKGDLPYLFERFYRVQSEVMKNFSGFGIGLYLCAEIVERHSGKIWVESEEGQGSTFNVTLPLEKE